MEKINPREAHENGDAEQSHNRFKQAVDQALQLRGSRDFTDRAAYDRFLREVLGQRNTGREKLLAEERAALAPLPSGRLESYKRARPRVAPGSVIHVDRNAYSVHSRLIGEKVDVRLYAEHLEVWYGGRVIERIPRLRGQGKHIINYRHVIDSLVRKPGAFENYKYREDMFPTSRFRMAYDALRETTPNRASREYLQILELAARENESLVDDALRALFEEDRPIAFEAVKEWVVRREAARPATEVQVELTTLSSFDVLFRYKEVWDGVGWVKQRLMECLRELHLPTFREEFEALARCAVQESLSYEQYLGELADQECQARRMNRIERWLRESGFAVGEESGSV